jgi:LCP family protein required for cell wall assembly
MRSRAVTVLIAIVLFLAGFFARGLWSGGWAPSGALPPPGGPTGPNADRTASEFTVLLLGEDNRPGQRFLQRTDTMIVLHVNLKTGEVAFLSVPRDTRVYLPGHGIQKINAAAEFAGSPMGAVEAVNRLLGTNIRYYLLTNFTGFQDLVNALGGVQVYVRTPMHYHASDVNIDLSPGYHWLNGTQALEFVRFREFALGDIGRTLDQQELLKAVARRLLSPAGLVRLPLVLPALSRAVQTNLPGRFLVTLLSVVRRLDTHRQKVLSETLPGDFLTVDGVSYWYVIPQDAVEAYAQLRRGKVMPGQPFDPRAVQAVTTGEWQLLPVSGAPAGGSGA